MWWSKKKDQQAEKRQYYFNLIQKAVPLVQYWLTEIERCRLSLNVKRAKRILNHIYRIKQIQQRAYMKHNFGG